ncbi:tetratricopeptide repeat protein 4 isoform X1 [Erpetoichthys calabaricus]|uniref:tetratricopeptide repeat protein 4 isoform X1 n=1 Tax=Erpetoichthys calabaricus TaxID=27687 RepID=UPI0022343C39|nr:tetratricopeptide repeat protein 4 isoform X1 [Erpetoichthys calabaricus]
MASTAQHEGDEEDYMDQFLDKFANQKYKGGFSEDKWEEEFDQVPMFMKKAPEEIDPLKNPELACLQSIIFDDDRPLEEQAKTYKCEGNEYFKQRDYKKAVISYTEGLKKKCSDSELNVILYTNRAAAHFYLGNRHSALKDVLAARKLKPNHLKAIIRGASCHVEMKNFAEALAWCDEGLTLEPKDKQLLELRQKADKLKRLQERDVRKAQMKEKKERSHKEALIKAIQNRGIKLSAPLQPCCQSSGDDEEEEESLSGGLEQLSLGSCGHQVLLDEQDHLSWPVLFLYPEYGQTDLIAAFHEETRFTDHLAVMFGEERPSWDADRKYSPQDLQLFFEDEEREELHHVTPTHTLRQVLTRDRCFIKGGTPRFIVLVKGSSFEREFLAERKVHGAE